MLDADGVVEAGGHQLRGEHFVSQPGGEHIPVLDECRMRGALGELLEVMGDQDRGQLWPGVVEMVEAQASTFGSGSQRGMNSVAPVAPVSTT